MSDKEQVVLVWKVPREGDIDIDIGDFHEIGIYPSGELMAVCRSEDVANSVIKRLKENSPSDRFGETMSDAPYVFVKSFRNLEGNS